MTTYVQTWSFSMINDLSVSIVPYNISPLNEDDIESLTNTIVKIVECGFESTILTKDSA